MSQQRKNFIMNNDPFECGFCGAQNGPLQGSCRNHCTQCLYSRHVDDVVPGDRASTCLGLMKPIGLDSHSKKGQMIIHECLTCGKNIRNIVARDDDFDRLVEVSKPSV